jgi:hypothetical protein
MKMEIFIQGLDGNEKFELFKLLSIEFLGKPKTDNYTSIDEFCRHNKMSRRLFNVLKENKEYIGEYIETIDLIQFKRCHGVGKLVFKEFVELRGY